MTSTATASGAQAVPADRPFLAIKRSPVFGLVFLFKW